MKRILFVLLLCGCHSEAKAMRLRQDMEAKCSIADLDRLSNEQRGTHSSPETARFQARCDEATRRFNKYID